MRDYAAETEARIGFIREQLKKSGAAGIVYGNSGGKDSALVGILCRMACENTVGIAMPCESRRNYEEDMADGLEVAAKFGIPCRKLDLTELKRLFVRTLEPVTELNAAAATNINPRLRMTALYAVAAAENRLVAGTGNLSERYVGYFTKWGDGACDFNPIGDLNVTEVYEFLRYLGAPEAILTKAPSAGLFEGQTDEKEMGVTYAEIDAAIAGKSVRQEAEEIIIRRHAASAHKRRMPPVYGEENGAAWMLERDDPRSVRCFDRRFWQERCCILLERELQGIPQLVFGSVKPGSLILARGKDCYYLLFRFTDGHLYMYRYVWDVRNMEEGFEQHDEEALAELSGFRAFLETDESVRKLLAGFMPGGMPKLEIREEAAEDGSGKTLRVPCLMYACDSGEHVMYRLSGAELRPGDICGLFSEDAIWVRSADGTVRILGSGELFPMRTETLKDSWNRPVALGMFAMSWFFRPGKPGRLELGEGIETIDGCLHLGNSDESPLEEVTLPRSLTRLPEISGFVRTLRVPPSVKEINFMESLFVECGGHWDPVTLSVRELVLPAGIRPAPDSLPSCEPVVFLETVRLYGEEPIPDLAYWYHSGFFGTELNIDLLYPAAWDGDEPGSYARKIVDYVRGCEPERPVFGMGADWEPWTEEDYRRLRDRILSY